MKLVKHHLDVGLRYDPMGNLGRGGGDGPVSAALHSAPCTG